MSDVTKKGGPRYKGELDRGRTQPLKLAAIGLESEFSLYVDGRNARPEKVFADPTAFIRQPLIRREGTSYHMPTGGAVYFDTGVIEVATPLIEIDRGCAARAGRSLWESILFVRTELDAWERRTGHNVQLQGFSSHYNVSFVTKDAASNREGRTVEDLALLLVHILPAPVMLVTSNRKSTGIGVRPRGDRIEITGDFTPSPSLMIGGATVITGVVREVMSWPSYALHSLADRGIPRIDGFEPIPHTSRKGWLARPQCFPRNPFQTGVDEAVWPVGGAEKSLRAVARGIMEHFLPAVKRIADPFTERLLHALYVGDAPTLLDLPDRPSAYEDVGRLCRWDDLFPDRLLSRSLYERVLIHAIAGDVLRIGGRTYRPVGMNGWSEVVFERLPDRTRQRFSIDFLIQHLAGWERKS